MKTLQFSEMRLRQTYETKVHEACVTGRGRTEVQCPECQGYQPKTSLLDAFLAFENEGFNCVHCGHSIPAPDQ